VLAGIVVLALGVAALPMSLRLLSWSSVRISTGGLSGDAMAGAVGAIRLNSRSATSASVQLATFMENAGPGSHQRLITGAGPVHSPGAIAGARAATAGASRRSESAPPAAPAAFEQGLTQQIPRYVEPAAGPIKTLTPTASTRGARR
jgi:hypothetical protein